VEIKLPMPVQFILNQLNDNGYEAYVVGGCVRDSIMGFTPHDWDVCTSALPEQVIDVFKDYKVIPTGIQHGTVSVVLEDTVYEITTYRVDGEYKDNRHPDSVEFVSNLKEDLARRDFTINAMAYNDKDGLIDYFGGIDDIKHKFIRCVGLPKKRFSEDALRIMRALRFAMVFGFDIEGRTSFAMDILADNLNQISIERINAEITKMLSCLCDKPLVNLLFYREVGFNKQEYNHYRVLYLKMLKYLHIINYKINAVDYIEKFRRIAKYSDSFLLNLAITFDSPQIEETLIWLRYSNIVIAGAKEIYTLGHYLVDEADEWRFDDLTYHARKLLAKIEHSDYNDIISFAESLCDNASNSRQINISISLGTLRANVAQCIENCDVYSLKYLAINGNDLIELGYKGKQIGKILNKLLDLVMGDRIKNTRAELLQIVKDGKLNAGI